VPKNTKTKLSELTLARLPEGIHWDTLLPAFGLRVGKNRRVFVTVKNGSRRRLGVWPSMKLGQARDAARKLMTSSEPNPEAFQTVLDAYIAAHIKKNWGPQSGAEIERLLRKHFSFGNKSIASISKRDVSIEVQKIESQSVANHANLAIKLLFNWAEKQGYVDRNALKSLPQPYKEESRDRVLAPDELRLIWHCSKQLGDYGRLVRLLMLTGQRRGQMAAIQSDWLKEDTIVFPGKSTKSRREHIIPLTTTTKASLKNLPFTLKHWDRDKKELDNLCQVKDWVLHDLRRSFATYMAQADVAPHIIELLLDHINPQSMGGTVALIYNRHRYLPQQREALEKYETWLAKQIQEPLI